MELQLDNVTVKELDVFVTSDLKNGGDYITVVYLMDFGHGEVVVTAYPLDLPRLMALPGITKDTFVQYYDKDGDVQRPTDTGIVNDMIVD